MNPIRAVMSHVGRCRSLVQLLRPTALAMTAIALLGGDASAQVARDSVIRIDLAVGRSFPIQTTVPITRVSVATPEIADVIVVGERDVVINAKAAGETDVIIWATNVDRRHYRVLVQSPGDRKMVMLAVKMAEVRKDVLRELGVSGRYRDNARDNRVGTGIFRSDAPIDRQTNEITLPSDTRFLTLLSDFGTAEFLAFIDLQEARGRARLLAEPNLIAGNRDTASFLAGGEIPVPIAQPGAGGQITITVQYREFGIRLNFIPEIIGDSLIKLRVRPEVSSLDYTNAVVLSGFRIPAFRTRRVETTVDVKRDESLIISGLFSEEREAVRTGIPFLMNIPILGNLFSSSRWQTNETELLVVVTPSVMDPSAMPAGRRLRIVPDTSLPAREAIEK